MFLLGKEGANSISKNFQITQDDAVLPGSEGKIVAWVDEDWAEKEAGKHIPRPHDFFLRKKDTGITPSSKFNKWRIPYPSSPAAKSKTLWYTQKMNNCL